MEAEVLGTAKVDAKGFVTDEVRTQIFRKLRANADNRTCFDCSCKNPTWLSLSHAVYLCLDCSGDHRQMGVHISFVRSVELDSFKPEQLCRVIAGGNRKANEFFAAHGVTSKRKDTNIGKKVVYSEELAAKHRQQVESDGQALFREYGLTASSGSKSPTPSDNIPKPTESVSSPVHSKGQQSPKYASAARAVTVPVSVPIPQPVVESGVSTIVRPFAAGVHKKGAPMNAKVLDFDFDFDEAEKNANLPPPVK